MLRITLKSDGTSGGGFYTQIDDFIFDYIDGGGQYKWWDF